MPKRRGKKEGGSRRGAAPNGLPQSSDDEDHRTPDNASVASSQSDMHSILEDGDVEGRSDEVDEQSAMEEFEEKLKDVIDGLTQKSSKGRTDCLKSLSAAFCKKYISDFIFDRKMTVQDCLERCLKKGKADEQIHAANCLSLLFLQLGASDETEEAFRAVRGLLQTLVLDKSVNIKARAACAQSLGICTFIAGGEIEDVTEAMRSLERVFGASYLKGDGTPPCHSPDVATLHSEALNSWALLLSISSPNVFQGYVNSHLSRVSELLQSGDVDLRITAGETLAVMYEIARDEDSDFVGEDFDELCQTLKQLSTDSNKYIAKKDRKQQRSSFREILRGVEDGDIARNRIQFGIESLMLDSWVMKLHYDSMCTVLGTGMLLHMAENELVRDIFGFGAPIPTNAKPSHKPSRLERHLYNAAAFKARTKVRSKNRDKRSAALAPE